MYYLTLFQKKYFFCKQDFFVAKKKQCFSIYKLEQHEINWQKLFNNIIVMNDEKNKLNELEDANSEGKIEDELKEESSKTKKETKKEIKERKKKELMDVWTPILEGIVEDLGGFDNITHYTHCMTRLRITVADESKVNEESIKKTKNSSGCVKVGTQYQIIFGPGFVNKVYAKFDEYFLAQANPQLVQTKIENVKGAGDGWWNKDQTFGTNLMASTRKALTIFANIFIPLIPMFVAGGMALAFKSLIDAIPGASESYAGAGFAAIFDTLGGALLGMLPVLCAYSTMKQIGGDPVYGIGIGLVIVAPSLVNSWSVQTAIQVGLSTGQDLFGFALENNFIEVTDGVITNILVNGNVVEGLDPSWLTPEIAIAMNNGFDAGMLQNLADFNGNTVQESAAGLIGTHQVIFSEFAWGIFSIHLIGYQAQVFSAILGTILTFWVYKLFEYIFPDLVSVVFVPLFTMFISAWLTLWIVGPIGRGMSTLIALLITSVYNTLNIGFLGFGGALMGFTNPLWGLTGLHQGFIAIEATLLAETAARYGESFSFVTAVGANCNIAMGASVLGYAIVVKSKDEKSMGVSAAITANLGITEPAVYGANLQLRYPYLAGMLGGAVGGFFVASTGNYCLSMGSASWLAFISFNPIVTDNYFMFLADQGIATEGFWAPLFLHWSPMAKELVANALAFTTALTMTIVFSQTKWAGRMNKEKNVEVHRIIGRRNRV